LTAQRRAIEQALSKATMPVRLDRRSADFDERFGLSPPSARFRPDVERATRAIVDDVAAAATPP
jgi:histidinol dehydrogenase